MKHTQTVIPECLSRESMMLNYNKNSGFPPASCGNDIRKGLLIKLIMFAVMLISYSGLELFADENIERLILPETSPSIERLSVSPLDRPVLKKQNFVPESSLELSQVWPPAAFPSMEQDNHIISIGASRGSFSEMSGNFSINTPAGWRSSFVKKYSDGEENRLEQDSNKFDFRFDSHMKHNASFWAGSAFEETELWDQRRMDYRFTSGFSVFAQNNISLYGDFSISRTEIKEIDINNAFGGNISTGWQPFTGQEMKLDFFYDRDSAFVLYDAFTGFKAVYGALILPGTFISGGALYAKDTFYPTAQAIWHCMPGTRLEILYEPGIEKPSWAKLYGADKYLKTLPGVIWPQSIFSLKETLSYYRSENVLYSIAFYQKDMKDYIYWSRIAESEYISPNNGGTRYFSGALANASMRTGFLTIGAGLEQSFTTPVELAPGLGLELSADYMLISWTFGAGYKYESERAQGLNDTPVAAYGDLSLHVKRLIADNIEFFISADNVFGQAIETQPHFLRRATLIESGINIKL